MGTKNIYSIFIWYFGKYKNTIARSEDCLPKLDIKAGFIMLEGFCSRVGSISIDSTFNIAFDSICTMEDPRIGKRMDFTPESEYEVIRELFSQKLYRPLVNPSNKV